MAQKHNEYKEQPMTRAGTIQGPSRRYRRVRHPNFPAAEWADKNPLLQRGELGIEKDTHKMKAGDGVTYWNDLPYMYDDAGQPLSTADYQMGNASGGWTTMSEAQQNALNSGATTTNIGQIATNTNDIATNKGIMDNHIANTNNPHSVTKDQVGLGNCDNTSDLDKPISTATQTALDGKQGLLGGDTSGTVLTNSGTAGTVTATTLATVATSGSYTDLSNKPTIGNATLTIQKNGTNVDTFTANATSNKTINITVPVTAADVNALPDSTKYVANASMTINSSTYVVTLQLKDQDGNNIGTAQTVDLPLETMVVSGSYDDATKKIILTLQNGQTIEFSVADLVSGLQTEITANNMLDADLVDDSTSTNKFVTSSDITTWNGKQDALTAGTNITISSNTISATDTTYTGSDGITLTGTNFTNSGVRSVATGSTNGTISVNTNGTSADVAVKGLGSAAYTASSAYATSAQGALADTAVQPGDLAAVATSGNYSDLTGTPGVMTGASAGDAGTSGLVPAPAAGDQQKFLQGDGTWANPTATTAWGNITGTLSDQTDLQSALNAKQDTLTAGTNITITSNTISATDTTYTGSDGITLTGTNFTNSGVRSVASGTTNGTINVNTGGTTADVAVTGLGSAAYTASSAYATSAQGGKADTAVQPGDLATVATSGDYGDLLNKPTIPTVNDATLTIQKNGTTVNTFTANASSNVTANITVPTKISDLTNDSNFANTDLSNLTSTGKNIGLWCNNAANIITEIPQDIKLELASNGTLTLKAGSKVYVPNGAGVFNTVTTTSDLTVTRTDTNDCMVWYTPSGNNLNIFPTVLFFSGGTAPTAYTFMYWYDTTNNICKVTTDQGSTWGSAVSFPICIVSTDGSKISAIKQVFNGIGYIGSTLFVLPGVKALHSAGFNSDGTLHNDVTTVQKVLVHTTPNATANQTGQLILNKNGLACQLSSNTFYWQYDSRRNLFVFTVNGDDGWIDIGTYVWDGTRITNFNPKEAFHAVDYNDTNVDFVVAEQLPTSANNYTWFRKYANGWVEQGGITTAQSISANNTGTTQQITFAVAMANANYCITFGEVYGEASYPSAAFSRTNVGGSLIQMNRSNQTHTIQFTYYVSGLAA